MLASSNLLITRAIREHPKPRAIVLPNLTSCHVACVSTCFGAVLENGRSRGLGINGAVPFRVTRNGFVSSQNGGFLFDFAEEDRSRTACFFCFVCISGNSFAFLTTGGFDTIVTLPFYLTLFCMFELNCFNVMKHRACL